MKLLQKLSENKRTFTEVKNYYDKVLNLKARVSMQEKDSVMEIFYS